MTDLERTAFHEAGHAVVSWALRVPIHSVTIDQSRTSDPQASKGELLHRPQGQHENPFHFYIQREPRAVARAKKYLAVKRAGIHAEMRAARLVYFGGSEEMETSPHETTLEDIEPGTVRRMDIQSRKLLAQHWRAVKALARELLEKKTMSGSAVRHLIRREVESAGPKR